jgi:hypothetical protein
MPAKFGPYPANRSTATIEESRADGYQTGRGWKLTWRPGGPWVCKNNYSADQNWNDYCSHTAACNRIWLESFDAGRSAA